MLEGREGGAAWLVAVTLWRWPRDLDPSDRDLSLGHVQLKAITAREAGLDLGTVEGHIHGEDPAVLVRLNVPHQSHGHRHRLLGFHVSVEHINNIIIIIIIIISISSSNDTVSVCLGFTSLWSTSTSSSSSSAAAAAATTSSSSTTTRAWCGSWRLCQTLFPTRRSVYRLLFRFHVSVNDINSNSNVLLLLLLLLNNNNNYNNIIINNNNNNNNRFRQRHLLPRFHFSKDDTTTTTTTTTNNNNNNKDRGSCGFNSVIFSQDFISLAKDDTTTYNSNINNNDDYSLWRGSWRLRHCLRSTQGVTLRFTSVWMTPLPPTLTTTPTMTSATTIRPWWWSCIK